MLSFSLYLFSLIIILGCTTLLFFVAQYKKDNSIVDIAYGSIFIVASLLLLIKVHNGYNYIAPASVALLTLITIWGLRLSLRVYKKKLGKGEDFRYAAWRKLWLRKGKIYFFARSYLQIFILQGIVISIVLLPFTLSLHETMLSRSGLILGGLLWCIGFLFEAMGDAQLDRFIKNAHSRKGHILKTGLWKYTRHPNYFGESVMWWGIAIISFSITSSLFVFLSPLLITYLLLYVSGIPMLEERFKGDPEWEDYKRKTSAFVPLPPKA